MAITDLIESEEHFIVRMQAGIAWYCRPLRHGIMSSQKHAKLFQNVEKLVALSEFHLKQLEAHGEVWCDGRNTGRVVDSVGVLYHPKVNITKFLHLLCLCLYLYVCLWQCCVCVYNLTFLSHSCCSCVKPMNTTELGCQRLSRPWRISAAIRSSSVSWLRLPQTNDSLMLRSSSTCQSSILQGSFICYRRPLP